MTILLLSNQMSICHIFTNYNAESALCKERYHCDFVSENVNLFPVVYLTSLGLIFPNMKIEKKQTICMKSKTMVIYYNDYGSVVSPYTSNSTLIRLCYIFSCATTP